jgi:hypothetical protein
MVFNTQTQLAHWSFNGTLDDISAKRLGPAVIVGGNVALAFDNAFSGELDEGYITIRNPGYVNVPHVNISSTSFTIAFSLRLPTASTTRQILLSDWTAPQWQFITTIDAAGTLSSTLRRNIQTAGSDPEQDLVSVTTAKPVPVGAWFDVALAFDVPTRTYTVYIDQRKSAASVVRSSVSDLTLHASTTKYYQFGNKADDGNFGELNADLRNLRLFASSSP